VVVEGMATVVNGNKTFILRKGEANYIPLGVSHALENSTNDALEVIEV
tara:strand:- start:76 stop:219 length:144 start_codon:yes stop_codon:yes gene_type:complete